MKPFTYALALGLATAQLVLPASAADITGAGATFPFPVYSKWAETYRKETGNGLNYQSIGSGGGIKQIQAKTVDFGATDAPLKGPALEKDGLIQFPTVMGGVVTVVNIAGLEPGKLKLTGEIVADIYAGKITKWSDPKIAALNEGLKLPDATITPVYRSDASGTTNIFTTYLSQVSESWKKEYGAATTVSWPAGQGGKGNEGVTATVKQVPNAIGYVESAYAKQNKLSHTLIQNKAGKFPQPDDKSFQAAAASADWKAQPGFGISLTNQAGDAAWPITAATFILVHKDAADAAKSAEVLKFFNWAYKNGDAMASELDYVPLPDNVVAQIHEEWKQVKGKDGKPVLGSM
ncbi:phosphate ABC transporter substrate-binding protein PstS [Methylobacterium gregans]|uniref:Phosphate-binding protein PstS n=1 Tax=Methylobacterium gregans TaxID=374424 RepID=A0AA37HUG3_9HYPH|nr:phosphate ABC transporter substrate-binding protein PstS [Methylobacterium gregans]MDQ0520485.1 phosphate transport system substrate-binding protein [Methylobacterium gregans]GJD81830.1 Phosphate-binding protein PstS [Methylobacterium gregans]GLS52256.1 phosphate-binding protein PstS [Methylobacterium gregans]